MLVIAKLALAASLMVATPPTFAVRAGQPGDLLYLEVSRTGHADVNGVFTNRIWSRNIEGRVRVTITPRRSRIWRPGSYYWHVYRVDCPFTGPRPHTCTERAVTPTRRIKLPGEPTTSAIK